MGVACLEMKDLEPNGRKKARDYFQEVVDRYADTVWADKARVSIQ